VSALSAIIIEDEVDLADIFSEALKSAGFETEAITSGDLAQSRLKEVIPNIIILDLHLPGGVDGISLLKQIRDDPRLVKTLVIVATADHNITSFLPRKPDLVLLKPISFNQLRDLVTRLVR